MPTPRTTRTLYPTTQDLFLRAFSLCGCPAYEKRTRLRTSAGNALFLIVYHFLRVKSRKKHRFSAGARGVLTRFHTALK